MGRSSSIQLAARAIAGAVIGLVARLWLMTLRVRWAVHPGLEQHRDVPWVLAHWHGQIMPLLAFRRRRATVAMVSRSGDGDLMAHALRWLGVRTVRGSRSNGGREALAVIVEMMGAGVDSVLAVDGPRGPRHVPKPGALAAAARAGGVVVPFAAHCERAWKARGSWDRFEVPWPFSRVAVVLGAPVGAARGNAAIETLAGEIGRSVAHAHRLLERDGAEAVQWGISESG